MHDGDGHAGDDEVDDAAVGGDGEDDEDDACVCTDVVTMMTVFASNYVV